jgi:hypothetical protein
VEARQYESAIEDDSDTNDEPGQEEKNGADEVSEWVTLGTEQILRDANIVSVPFERRETGAYRNSS